MEIYIVEKDTDEHWEEPVVFTDGKKAVSYIRDEYEKAMEESGASDHTIWECHWDIDENTYSGTAEISNMYWLEYWRWRLTEFIV